MKTIEEIWSIVNGLKELYPDGVCSLDYRKDYELLFSVRLAAQCTDERVNKVTPALYARFPTLEALAEADIAEVERYIHSTRLFPGQGEGHRAGFPDASAGLRRAGCRTPWRSC